MSGVIYIFLQILRDKKIILLKVLCRLYSKSAQSSIKINYHNLYNVNYHILKYN